MPIILTLFSTKMWFLLFSNYSGNNLPRPNERGDSMMDGVVDEEGDAEDAYLEMDEE